MKRTRSVPSPLEFGRDSSADLSPRGSTSTVVPIDVPASLEYLQHIHPGAYHVALIQLRTGLRVSEVLGLRWEHRLRDDVFYCNLLKGNRARNISIGKSLQYLQPLTSARTFLFEGLSRKVVHKYYKRAGITYRLSGNKRNSTTHILRYMHLSDMLNRGVDSKGISQAIGHQRIATTENYLDKIKRHG